jgi:hypothetical protein
MRALSPVSLAGYSDGADVEARKAVTDPRDVREQGVSDGVNVLQLLEANGDHASKTVKRRGLEGFVGAAHQS